MSTLKNNILKNLNLNFNKKVHANQEQNTEHFATGEFLTLYSLKTIVDDKPFYFVPFCSISTDELCSYILKCQDYSYRICQLGFYNVTTGELYQDYKELDSIHEFLKKYSKKYDLVSSIFKEEDMVNGSLYDYAISHLDKNLYSIIKDYMSSNNLYFPDFDDVYKSVKDNEKEELNALIP